MLLRPQPKVTESISVLEFFNAGKDHLKLSLVAGEKGLKHLVRDKSINRPALALTGYFKNFAAKRLQLFGAGEMAFLRDIPESKQTGVLTEICRREIPCIIVSRQLAPTKPLFEAAARFSVPLIRTPLSSRDFMNTATLLLEDLFAPRITEHGTLMDIKGIGTLIRGESGMGKSECALALVARGHSLVADDLVQIKLIGEREVLGMSSDLNRGYMECRGLGIVNIAELYGIRSVRASKAINLVITFVDHSQGVEEDRTGLEQDFFEILGQQVPHVVLSVRPGRDYARLVEVAAMIQSAKALGHDSAREFNERLIAHMSR